MKVFGEIKTSLTYSCNIGFDKEYAERFAMYKQSSGGRSFVVDFEFRIIPGNENIVVYWIEDEINAQCIEHIFKGLERFIADRNHAGVGISPFEIVISNCIIHPVDFDKRRFVDYTTKRMTELSFEIGKKKYLKMNRHSSTFEAVKIDARSYLFSRASVEESTYTIQLPNRKKQKLILPVAYGWHKHFIKQDFDDTSGMTLVIEDGDTGFRHPNQIDLVFAHGKSGSNAFLSIIDGLKKFVDDVHDAGYDLGGFNIYIREADMIYPVRNFAEAVYWSLKELFASGNKIDSL